VNAWPSALPQAVPASTSGIRRILIPSFSDLFFLSLIAWLFMSTPDGWSRVLGDGDTGWHIRTGDYVLDHMAVPRTDLFSFTLEGKPWFAWEWGSDVIFALLHRALGLKGIALLGGVLIGLYATVLFRYTLWRGANALLALTIALLAVGASTIHYLARPHLFTLVLVPVSVWMIDRDRRQRWWGVWLLIPIAAAWTNLHGGFMALIAMLGLLAAGRGIAELLNRSGEKRDWSGFRRYSILTAGCSAATLLNPYGIELHKHIATYLQSDWIREAIQEFQSPSFRNENIMQFEALMLAALIACGPMIARRAFPEVLWIVFWAHQALGSVRHVTVFVSVAAPILATEATRLWDQAAHGADRRSIQRILADLAVDMGKGFRWTSVWPVIGVAVLLFGNVPVRWPADFPADRFPTAMATRHAEKIQSGRVITTDQWGDYLIYRFYPRMRVYIDGRSDFYGPKLGKEYVRLSYGQYNWRATVQQHGFDVALIPVEWSLGSLLKVDPSWRLLEDDGKALLFVRVKGEAPRGPRDANGGMGQKAAAIY
jgi:hypothetical protein